jgi:hypothetical protein
MKSTEIKAPELICKCGKKMEVTEQSHMSEDNIQIKYKCECGFVGFVLLYLSRGLYDEFIKDSNGTLARYEPSKVIEVAK